MESKYEYKVSESKIITLSNVAGQNPNAEEFGWFIKWLCSKNNGCIAYKDEVVNSRIVSMLVSAGKFTWLDWLAEKGFVTRTEKRRELTIDDLYLETSNFDHEVNLCVKTHSSSVGRKVILEIKKDGSVRRCNFAKNDLIPTDEDGKIIIK